MLTMLTSIDKFTYDPKTKRLTTNGPAIGIPSGDAMHDIIVHIRNY